MKIPEKLKVGPYLYEVLWDGKTLKEDQNYAHINYLDLKITLDPDKPRERIEKSFLHEIIHACEDLATQGHEKNGCFTETQVVWLSNLLYMVLKENGMLAEEIDG